MKILLLGEFSGLHTNLKVGLENLNHKVTLVSFGDGFKKLTGDINFGSDKKNKVLKILHIWFKFFYYLPRFKGYDVVHYIYPNIFPFPFQIKLHFLKFLKRNNKLVTMNVSGGDAYMIPILMGKLRYSPYTNSFNEKKFNGFFKMIGYEQFNKAIKLAITFDGIISSLYEYALPYKGFKNYLGIIPFPSLIPNTLPDKLNIDGKIKIFHGVTRKEMKGSNYIIQALKLISKEYSGQVEVEIVEKVPYYEYKELFNDCHIFIDQACSYGYAMNALLALAKGKVVLSGCEKEHRRIVGDNCPVINIQPSTLQIYKTIRNLIENKGLIQEIGSSGYSFVKEVHDCNKIANDYLKKWEQIKK